MTELKSTWTTLWFPYVKYVMYFLGVGLISGSIVHLPMDPLKYFIILLFGVALFTIASILNEIYVEKKELNAVQVFRIILFSLFLSLGIGMMSGAIQHFTDIMEYATLLIPIGFVLSLISFIFRNNIKLSWKQIGIVLTISITLVVSMKTALNIISHQYHSPGHHEEEKKHGGHGH